MRAKEINVHTKTGNLSVTFDTGETVTIPAQLLRVYSPSAEVKGHGAEPPKLVKDKEAVKILSAELVGHYALRIEFDDLHDTGIYRWEYLHDLGVNQQAYTNMYQQRLLKG